MFSNYESDVVGFESNWKIEKDTTENGSQTTEYKHSDKETSTTSTNNISIQTEATESKLGVEFDNKELEKWLVNIAPKVMSELKLTKPNSIFQSYDPFDNDNQSVKATHLQTIQAERYENYNEPKKSNKHNEFSSLDLNIPKNNAMPIIGLSWSSAGNTLAIASGFLYHEDWCQHSGAINIYSKRGNVEELSLIHNAKLSSCASSISFHSAEPALLAAATFSGEILIFNLQYLEDTLNRDLLVASNSSSHFGRKISILNWINSEQTHKYFPDLLNNTSEKVLISGASDGKINIWTFDITMSTLTLKICYKLKSTSNDKLKQQDISCIGLISCWERLKHNKDVSYASVRDFADDYFVIGTKTGELLLCKTLLAKSLISKELDPYIGDFEPHNSCILSLKFCSIKQTIFLTLGADHELRIYDLLMDCPMNVIILQTECSSFEWLSNSDSLILLSASQGSKKSTSLLQIFNIDTKSEIPLEGLQKLKDSNDAGVTTMSLNKSISNRVAYGDMLGRVKIWSIPFKDIVIPKSTISI